MASTSANASGDEGEAKPGYRVVRIRGELVRPAAQRLAEASSADPNAGMALLAAAETHAIDVSRMWGSTPVSPVEGGEPGVRHVCLMVPGAGRTGMFFTSRPTNAAGERELGAVIDAACGSISPMEVRLAQALLEPNEESLARAFEAGGFDRLSTLLYLRRPAPRRREFRDRTLGVWPPGVRVERYRQLDENALAAGLARTYQGTLDCPELTGIRTTTDVIESHRAAGAFDRRFWFLVWFEGRVEGVMLFNPIPDQQSIDLVYFGIAPALRGQGLGAKLLEWGLCQLVDRPELGVTCACDERNEPARRLYARLGFVTADRRTALVRALGG
jgi:GNAT superfamily N-acetyltransferase